MEALLAAVAAQFLAEVSRAAGWSIGRFAKKRRRRRVESLFGDETELRLGDSVKNAGADDIIAVNSYLSSAEFAYVAGVYARAYLLWATGASADEVLELGRATLDRDLHERSIANPDRWVNDLHAALVDLAGREAKELVSTSEVSPKLEAELRKTAASIVQAGGPLIARKLDIERRAQIIDFATSVKSQTAALMAHMSLPHAGISRRVPYDDLFVEPRVEYSRLNGVESEIQVEDLPLASVREALAASTRAVIVGDPGGGKSTLAQKYVYDSSQLDRTEGADVPFLVVLRDFAPQIDAKGSQSFVSYIESSIAFTLSIDAPQGAVDYLLRIGRAVVVFDGIDELLDASLRSRVVQAVEGFAYMYPLASILVTSRRVGYEDAPLDPDLFPVAELAPFTSEQVSKYAENWFRLDESIPTTEQALLTDAFVRDSRFVSDLRTNPLMLALMCGIYATERYIPRNRPDVYEKCANLLFEKWDKQRSIEMALPFDALVQAAIRALALHMYQGGSVRTEIHRSKALSFLTEYLHRKRFATEIEAESAAAQFLDFCKGRAWVLTEVGAEKYSFTHRTFLEYFAASQLVRLYPVADELYSAIGDDLRSGNGSVVNELALQILGKATEDGADEFLTMVLDDAEAGDPEDRAKLLGFFAAALSFLVPHPRMVERFISCLFADVAPSEPDRHLSRLRILVDLPHTIPENAAGLQAALDASLAPASDDPEAADLEAASVLWNFPLLPMSSGVANDTPVYPATWVEWHDGVQERLRPVLTAHRNTSPWAAGQLFVLGDLELITLVQQHGLKVIYQREAGIFAPLSTQSLTVFERTSDEISAADAEWLARALHDGTIDATLSVEEMSAEAPFNIIGLLDRDTPSIERLIISLPWIEALTHTDLPARSKRLMSRLSLPVWVRELVSLRSGETLALTEEGLTVALASGSEASALANEWSEGTFNFFPTGVDPAGE